MREEREVTQSHSSFVPWALRGSEFRSVRYTGKRMKLQKSFALALVWLAVLTSFSIIPSAGASTPSTIRVSVSVNPSGELVANWQKSSLRNATYWVSTVPSSGGCVVKALTCRITVGRSGAVKVAVVAESAGKTSPPSYSHVVQTRTIVLLAGQSNAFGSSSLALDQPSGINLVDQVSAQIPKGSVSLSWSSLFALDQPQSASGYVPLATPQIESPLITGGISNVQFFGPELGIAKGLFSSFHEPLSVLKVTVPNSNLLGNWSPLSKYGCFSNLVHVLKNHIALDAKNGIVDFFQAVVWYQGESDAMNLVTQDAYVSALGSFFGSLDRAVPAVSNAPLILVKESIAAFIELLSTLNRCGEDRCLLLSHGDAAVREADEVFSLTRPRTSTVDSLGLDRTDLYVHLTNHGELQLGLEIAAAIVTQQLAARSPDRLALPISG